MNKYLITLLILILAVIISGIGVILFYNQPNQPTQPTSRQVTPNDQTIDNLQVELIDIGDGWKRYVNEVAGIQFEFEDKEDKYWLRTTEAYAKDEIIIGRQSFDGTEIILTKRHHGYFITDPETQEKKSSMIAFFEASIFNWFLGFGSPNPSALNSNNDFYKGAEPISMTQNTNTVNTDYYEVVYYDNYLSQTSNRENVIRIVTDYYFEYPDNSSDYFVIRQYGEPELYKGVFYQILDSFKFIEPEVITSDIDTSDWQIYRNGEIGLEFSYPVNWGEPIGELRNLSNSQSGETGYSMDLYFRESKVDIENKTPYGGGRSIDFSARRGAYFADYKGFQDKSAQENCDFYTGKSRCKAVNENIVSILRVPEYAKNCPPGPATNLTIEKQIFISLPKDHPLSGFTFKEAFLSENVNTFLLGDEGDLNCENSNDEWGEEFDRKVNEILYQIDNKLSDEETLRNLDYFEEFIGTIKILN